MNRPRGFEFRLVPTLVALAGCAFLAGLGVWQLSRAADKRALLASFDTPATPVAWRAGDVAPPRFTPVEVTGRYDAQRQILMEGLFRAGRPGYEVLTPLRTDDGRWLIVNRGWLPWQGDRDALTAPPAPDGLVSVRGRARGFARPGMRLGDGNASTPATWPRLAVYPTAREIGEWLDAPVAETLILLDPQAEGGFARDWRPDTMKPSRHVGYALQWFALAIALAVIFVLASRRRRGEHA